MLLDPLLLILMLHFAATLCMAGIIWFVQIVHYPLLARVGAAEAAAYEKEHRSRTFWVVGPLMLVEGLTLGLLCRQPLEDSEGFLLGSGAALLAMIWLSTAFLQVPCHKKLSQSFDAAVHRRLVRSNWIRTIGWSLRVILVAGLVAEVWLATQAEGSSAMKRLQEGEPAPVFTATAHDGQRIALEDYRGKSAVVLFFYPKDGTTICTQEACAFRDSYEKFAEAGAVVIGISSDSNDSHRKFATDHRLSFPLISDQDGALRKLFAVPNNLGLLPGRVTYVIDQQGVIRLIFNAAFASQGHVEAALKALGPQPTPTKS